MNDITHPLRDYREKLQWTQQVLSVASGLSIRTIQRIESGEIPSKESLLALAAALDVNVEDLLFDNDSCLLYTSPSPRDRSVSRMPSSA